MNQILDTLENHQMNHSKAISGLIYLSNTLVPFDQMSVEALALEASAFNQSCGISGYLIYYQERFIQYIEGEAEALLGLMGKIRLDQRHQIVQEIHLKPSKERIFPNWSMRLITPDLVDKFAFDLCLERIIKMHRLASGDSLFITQDLLVQHLKSVERLKRSSKF